jgi:hypothetical protein
MILYDRFVRNPASLTDLTHTVGRPLVWKLSEVGDESPEIDHSLSAELKMQMGVDDKGNGSNLLGKTLMEIRACATRPQASGFPRQALAGLLQTWLTYTLGRFPPCTFDVSQTNDGILMDEFSLDDQFILIGKSAYCHILVNDDSVSDVHAVVLMDERKQFVVVDLNSISQTRVRTSNGDWDELDALVPRQIALPIMEQVMVSVGDSLREFAFRRQDERILVEMEAKLESLNQKDELETWVFVGNLPGNPVESDVEEVLDPNGIRSIEILKEKRCAFVQAKDMKWLERFLLAHGTQYQGSRICVRRKRS